MPESHCVLCGEPAEWLVTLVGGERRYYCLRHMVERIFCVEEKWENLEDLGEVRSGLTFCAAFVQSAGHLPSTQRTRVRLPHAAP